MHSINNILFLDIETVPQYASYNEVPAQARPFWNKKAEQLRKEKETDTPEILYHRAGIYAEFGKIVCISCGIISGSGTEKRLLVKSFCCDEENVILADFSEMLKKWYAPDKVLCAHNGKEFDFPYLSRRMIINHLPVPGMLKLAGKRPWEIPHLDTLELWKFGDYKSYTTLSLLAFTFGIPTPKDDIDGSMVSHVYYIENDLKRISTYCQKDVITLVQVYLRIQGESLVKTENIEYKS